MQQYDIWFKNKRGQYYYRKVNLATNFTTIKLLNWHEALFLKTKLKIASNKLIPLQILYKAINYQNATIACKYLI